MRENIALLNFLRSNRFILYVAILTVVFLSPNTYFVFHKFSAFISPYREVASAGVAFIIAASIMIFTLRKNLRMARFYAWFEFCISAYYYITIVGWSWNLIPALGFAAILPLSVSNYAKEIDVDLDLNDPDLNKWLEENPTKRPSDYIRKK